MTCGIYQLIFPNTSKVYIGQSKNMEDRIKSHLASMKAGTSSSKLNNAYLIYGPPSMVPLMECEEKDLNTLEDEAISIFNSVEEGFNSCKKAGGGSSLFGEDRSNSLYSNEEIIVAFNALFDHYYTMTLNEISLLVGVSKAVLNQIGTGVKHRWIEKFYPEKYHELLSRKGTKKSGVQSAGCRGIVYPTIVSPEGVEFTVTNVSAFSKEHNLDCGNLNRLLNKKAKSHRGWKIKT